MPMVMYLDKSRIESYRATRPNRTVHYYPDISVDERDLAKAREFKQKYPTPNSVFLAVVCVLCLMFPVMLWLSIFIAMMGTGMAWLILFLGGPLTLIAIAKMADVFCSYLPSEEERYRGYCEWMAWKKLRSHEYYSDDLWYWIEGMIKTCVKIPDVVLDHSRSSSRLSRKYDSQSLSDELRKRQSNNIWTCPYEEMPWIDPLNFLKSPTGEYYDYTMFLEELAYYYMVYCTRRNSRATLLEFAEATAYILLLEGDLPRFSMPAHRSVFYIPFNQMFPVAPTQKTEWITFDFLVYEDSSKGLWLKGIWKRATERYLAELKTTKGYHDCVVNISQSYLDNISNEAKELFKHKVYVWQNPPSYYAKSYRNLHHEFQVPPLYDIYKNA